MRFLGKIFLITLMLCSMGGEGHAKEPVRVGLSADMTSAGSPAGIAIQRGLEMAIDAINLNGGLMGRPVELVVADHRGNPARGVDHISDFAKDKNLIAIFGGLHTPVAMEQLAGVHKHKVPFLIPWAAGTPVVDNNFSPNFVFRLSVRDEYAGGYLVDQAIARGHKRIGLLLEKTGWGRSNERAIVDAVKSRSEAVEITAMEWFHWGAKDLSRPIARLQSAQSDVILFVGNSPEGLVLLERMAFIPRGDRLPILSHWGITGGKFFENALEFLDRNTLEFLQTVSFLEDQGRPEVQQFVDTFIAKYDDVVTAREIRAPVGTAHAYDLMRYLAQIVERAQSLDREDLQKHLEQPTRFEGLFRVFDPMFTPLRHDAMDVSDFRMARFARDGAIELE